MRAAISTVFCCSLLAAAASSQSTSSEPSPMEALSAQQGVRTTWSNEVARWEQDHTRVVFTAVVLEDSTQSPLKIRGLKVDLSGVSVEDLVYLDEKAIERTRSALEE